MEVVFHEDPACHWCWAFQPIDRSPQDQHDSQDLPLVSLTQTGEPAVPAVIVEYPWTAIIGLELAVVLKHADVDYVHLEAKR